MFFNFNNDEVNKMEYIISGIIGLVFGLITGEFIGELKALYEYNKENNYTIKTKKGEINGKNITDHSLN
ncbi:hypothetical protein [Sigmofec virus UA08Rod_5336]|uniref:Uncharacterized protein n=1 Tax=Sigmofec virus UA08Rod_5336 TaxID=2929419 RepID=A0A976N0X2_9VIRU|nr:hypothetical protein [Sigmofec virus UA08Rod_5336]